MASVSTKVDTVASASDVSHIIGRIVDSMDESCKKKIAQWLKLIEEHSEKIIRKLTPSQVKRRNMEAVAAAAVYDGFLEYESRTSYSLSLPKMQEVLGRSICSINTTWNKLFDRRASLMGEYLGVVYIEKDGDLVDAIHNVMQAIRKAVEEPRSEVNSWLDAILEEACELEPIVNQDDLTGFDTLVAAATLIYAAMKLHHGKTMIRISQRDFALLAASSSAMISKCWIDLFGNKN